MRLDTVSGDLRRPSYRVGCRQFVSPIGKLVCSADAHPAGPGRVITIAPSLGVVGPLLFVLFLWDGGSLPGFYFWCVVGCCESVGLRCRPNCHWRPSCHIDMIRVCEDVFAM